VQDYTELDIPPVGDEIVHEPYSSKIEVGNDTVIIDVVLMEVVGRIVTLYVVYF
jgi:hypothetical protein